MQARCGAFSTGFDQIAPHCTISNRNEAPGTSLENINRTKSNRVLSKQKQRPAGWLRTVKSLGIFRAAVCSADVLVLVTGYAFLLREMCVHHLCAAVALGNSVRLIAVTLLAVIGTRPFGVPCRIVKLTARARSAACH